MQYRPGRARRDDGVDIRMSWPTSYGCPTRARPAHCIHRDRASGGPRSRRTLPMAFGRRLRDLPVRSKLLLLAGLPLLESVLLLLVLHWAYRTWSAAFEEALGWQRHAALETQIELSAEADVGGIGDRFITGQHGAGELEAAEEALQRASAASLEMAFAFSADEQEEERHLSSLVAELVSQGAAVGESKVRFASLHEFYEGPLRAAIHQRVSAEQQGSQRAIDSAKRLSRMMLVNALIASVATLLAILLLC